MLRATCLAAGLLLAVTACGSTDNGVATGRADSSATTDSASPASSLDTTPIAGSSTTEIVVPASTEPSITQAPITLPVTTPPPSTTPTSTTPVTVTVAGVPGGWVAVDSFPADVVPPLDESNQTGVPSPALPTRPGQPLADGIYDVQAGTTPWSAANPNVLDVSVHRYELCTVIPDSCITYGDPFGPTELGIGSASYDLTVPLTNQIGVGLTGYDCQAIDKTGNGADLAALFTAFDAAYAANITPLLGGTANPVDVLTAAPAGGFTGESVDCSGGLLFKAGNAPPLLLQTASNQTFDANGNSLGITPLSVTDEIRLETLVVSKGLITLYLYAGFFS